MSVIQLLRDNPTTVDKTIDLTIERLSSTGDTYRDGAPDPALNMYFPLTSYQSTLLALRKFKNFAPTIASVVEEDQDIPIRRGRISLTQENIDNIKVATKYLVTEKDLKLLFELENSLLRNDQQTAQAIKDEFCGIPATLEASCTFTGMMLSLKLATTGKCTYTDAESKAKVQLSYLDSIPSGHIASTKTGTSKWSNLTNATGIQDIVDHLKVVYRTLRRYPNAIVMNLTEADNLRNQNSTKEMIAREKGIITDGQTVDASALANIIPPTLEEISMLISRLLLDSAGMSGNARIEIKVSDSIYYLSEANNDYSEHTYVPEGYYFFAWNNYIERAILPCAGNEFAGGIAINYDTQNAPRREWIAAECNMLPLCADPRKIAGRKVE